MAASPDHRPRVAAQRRESMRARLLDAGLATIVARGVARVLVPPPGVRARVPIVPRVWTLLHPPVMQPRPRPSSACVAPWRRQPSPKESKHAATFTEKVPQGAEGP